MSFNFSSASFGAGIDPRNKRKLVDIKSEGDEKKPRQIDQSEQCDYCMQEMKKERDPRELLCGHIFCLSCLKDDWTSKGATSHKCITCEIVYQEIDFDSLPSVQVCGIPEAEKLAINLPLHYCDRCVDKPAVRYCIDCGVKGCGQHMQHHDGFFEGLHKTLDILKYAENPSLYNKAVICKQHKECITMACRNCYQYNCIKCCEDKTSCKGSSPVSPRYSPVSISYSPGFTGYTTGHRYYPLAAIEKEITQDFTRLLQQTNGKLAEIERLDKKAWDRHDQLLVKCKEMIAEVESKSAEQIEQIRIQTQQLKEAIQQYQTETEGKVVKFSTELIGKREQVEDVRRTTHKFLRNKHVTELIKAKQEKVHLLSGTNAIDIREPDWEEKFLLTGSKLEMEVKLGNRRVPTNPFFVSKLSWKGRTITLC